jgi:capsular exopolysaccharide synthesis family protein
VLDVRKKIAATHEFYAKLGVDIPKGDARPGTPTDPGLNPKIDVVATFVGSLKREIAELDRRDAELTRQFDAEMIKAKDLAIVQIEDQERSGEIKNDIKLLDAIVNQINVLNIGKDTAGFSMRVIAEPSEGLDLKRQIKIVGGVTAALMGLLFGALYLQALLDTRLKSPEEVQQTLGLSVMGRVPTINFGTAQRHFDSLIDPAVYYFHNPDTPAAEAYRSVRTALFVMLPARGWKVLQVTSSEPQDGKTTLSTCLAVSMAQAGKKVLLIDADLRCPKVHAQFGLNNQLGLSDVLAGEIEPATAMHQTEVPGLTILGSGISPANPAEMLSSPRLEQLLKDARRDFDFVIVDTPPLLAVTDPAQVAPHVDGVLLVVRLQKNRAASVKRAHEVLQTQGVTPLGVVVTGVEPRATYGAYTYRTPSVSKPAVEPVPAGVES